MRKKQAILEFEKPLGKSVQQSEVKDERLIYFFDDESLESLLYGQKYPESIPANLYLSSQKSVKEILQVYEQGDMAKTIQLLRALGFKRPSLSLESARQLVQVIKIMVPQYPLPVIRFDLWALSPLIETIWELAIEKNEQKLKLEIGFALYRWLEHLHQYEAARGVLQALINEYDQYGLASDKAIFVNNYAYEYLLEERYAEAAPFFEEAASLFNEAGDRFETANARANYWICLTAKGPITNLSGLEEALPEIEEMLLKKKDWRGRKPLFLRARMAEEEGNIEEAISLMGKAIESAKESNTQYPVLDRQYLKKLQRKRKNLKKR
jgi:tetratricopeptide (TPR) repeat protein